MRQDDARPMMKVVPWAGLRDLRPVGEPAALGATWCKRFVLVVSAVTFRRWVAKWSVATVDHGRFLTEGSPADILAEPVDLLETLRAGGVVARTVPKNALVVENCHRVELGNVVVTLDQAFTDYLTSGGAGPQASNGRYRVLVKNSRGVRIGDRCTHRNRFVHRITTPTIRLGDFCGPDQLPMIAGKVDSISS